MNLDMNNRNIENLITSKTKALLEIEKALEIYPKNPKLIETLINSISITLPLRVFFIFENMLENDNDNEILNQYEFIFIILDSLLFDSDISYRSTKFVINTIKESAEGILLKELEKKLIKFFKNNGWEEFLENVDPILERLTEKAFIIENSYVKRSETIDKYEKTIRDNRLFHIRNLILVNLLEIYRKNEWKEILENKLIANLASHKAEYIVRSDVEHIIFFISEEIKKIIEYLIEKKFLVKSKNNLIAINKDKFKEPLSTIKLNLFDLSLKSDFLL